MGRKEKGTTVDNQWRVEKDGEEIVQTCAWSPPGCHPVGCGLLLHIKDGRLVKVEGDPSHPITQGRLCVRCLALPEYVYHEDRILHPMVRDREDRGKDKWNEISWDDAFDLIEEKVKDLKMRFGPETMLVLAGTGRQCTQFEGPLAYAALGTPNQSSPLAGQACYGPRGTASHILMGAGYPEIDHAQFFEDRYDDPRFTLPKYVILWGKDPLWSNPDGLFGHSIIDMMKRGTRIITIDPRINWIATKAEYNLQLRPGTDAAIGLGLLNVIINEDLYDHDFVENWCYGFDELHERVNDYPPERVEKITWVPKETLVQVARAFAGNAPSSICWGLALDQQTNGMQASQALLSVAAICGYLDVPGGITITPTGLTPTKEQSMSFLFHWRSECYANLPDEIKQKRIISQEKYAAWNACATQAHDDLILDALETDKPYPVKMLWFFGCNPLACTGVQPHRWYEAALRTDFNVVQDCFMTPTAMGCCDLFLPLSTFAEHDGIVVPEYGLNTNFVGTINKAITVGDCKSDLEITLEVGRRLNPEKWPWSSVQEFFDSQFDLGGTTFQELRETGAQLQPYEYRKYLSGHMRPDGKPGFDTTTGLFELKSVLFETWGEDPLPYFKEPILSPYSREDLAQEYPLVLTTGGRKPTSFHSEHRQIASLRQIDPWPTVQINPETAKRYGIEDGDWVCMENILGKAVEKAVVTPAVDPRVIHATHGFWYPEQEAEAPSLFGTFESNVNNLIPRQAGILGWGAPYKNVICKIYRVDGHDCVSEDDAVLMRDNDLECEQ